MTGSKFGNKLPYKVIQEWQIHGENQHSIYLRNWFLFFSPFFQPVRLSKNRLKKNTGIPKTSTTEIGGGKLPLSVHAIPWLSAFTACSMDSSFIRVLKKDSTVISTAKLERAEVVSKKNGVHVRYLSLHLFYLFYHLSDWQTSQLRPRQW